VEAPGTTSETGLHNPDFYFEVGLEVQKLYSGKINLRTVSAV